MCRHTVGLNYTAIGIEHVGTSDAQILGNPRQLAASLRLTVWLMHRFGIQLRNVIGHNESLHEPLPSRALRRPGAARRTATGRTPTWRSTGAAWLLWPAATAFRSALPARPVHPRC